MLSYRALEPAYDSLTHSTLTSQKLRLRLTNSSACRQAQTSVLPMPSGSKRSSPPALRRATSGWASAAWLTVRVTCTRLFVLS